MASFSGRVACAVFSTPSLRAPKPKLPGGVSLPRSLQLKQSRREVSSFAAPEEASAKQVDNASENRNGDASTKQVDSASGEENLQTENEPGFWRQVAKATDAAAALVMIAERAGISGGVVSNEDCSKLILDALAQGNSDLAFSVLKAMRGSVIQRRVERDGNPTLFNYN